MQGRGLPRDSRGGLEPSLIPRGPSGVPGSVLALNPVGLWVQSWWWWCWRGGVFEE